MLEKVLRISFDFDITVIFQYWLNLDVIRSEATT